MKENNSIKNYLIETPNFLSLFIRPVFFILLSPILIEASKTLNTTVRSLNLVFTFFTVGYLLGNLTSIFYNKIFQKLHTIIFSYIILIAANIILVLFRSLNLYYLLYSVCGYFLGVIWLQANSYLAESRVKNKIRLNMIALSFFPIGSLLAPFMVTAVISRKIEWWYLYFVVVIIAILNLILYLAITRNKKHVDSNNEKEKIVFKGIFKNKHKNTIIRIRVLLTFLYTIPVTIIITWFPTFFRMEKTFNYKEAGLTVSIFYISMIFGRIIISLLENRIKMDFIIIITSVIASVSLVFMIFLNYKILIFIAICFAGIGFAGLFPFLVSTISSTYKEGKKVLLTIIFSAEGLGQAIAPYLTGLISKFNMTLSVALSLITSVVIFILLIIDFIYRRKTYKEIALI